jgi:protein gp37
MSAATSIEWTSTVNPDGTVTKGKTWNPVRGCSVVSPGCVNCYAMKFAHRFSGAGKPYEGLTKQTKAGPQWTGVVRYVHDEVAAPLRWRKPARVFVNSMSDLFHEGVTDAQLIEIFAVMANCPEHTFQVLTKRPDRMRPFLTRLRWRVGLAVVDIYGTPSLFARLPYVDRYEDFWERLGSGGGQPAKELDGFVAPNVWLGVSVENQVTAEARIPWLLETPAATRFVSYEPALGPVDFTDLVQIAAEGYRPQVSIDALRGHVKGPDDILPTRLSWVIVGGESGPGARPFDIAWARSVVAQCREAHVPVFVKQLGALPIEEQRAGHPSWPLDPTWRWMDGKCSSPNLKDRKGGDMDEWPEDLRVREFPRGVTS